MRDTTATFHIMSLLLERCSERRIINVKDIQASFKKVAKQTVRTMYDAVKPTPENIRWFTHAIIRYVVYIWIWEQFICKHYSLF